MCRWQPASCRRKRVEVEQQGMDDIVGDSLIPGLPQDMAVQCLARVPISSIHGVCKRWQEMVNESEDFHYARAERGKSDVNWLYTLVLTRGGSYEWNAFDPLTGRWHPLPPMPDRVDFQLTTPGSIGLSHAVQCVSTRRLLVMVAGLKPSAAAAAADEGGDGMIGGQQQQQQNWSQLEPALQEPWIFDPKSRQWRKGQAFHTPRKWCVCGAADDKVYMASGSGLQWDMSLSKRAEVYDPEYDSWSPLPDLESSKFSGEAITPVNVEGKLHMVSGRGVFVKEGVVLCPKTNRWSKMKPGLKRGWIGTCVSTNDRFYLVDDMGGKVSTYSAESDSWRVIMEDAMLKDMTNVTASDGKIFGLISTTTNNSTEHVDDYSSTLRIIDVTMDPPLSYTQAVPQGRVVSMQILAKMNVQKKMK